MNSTIQDIEQINRFSIEVGRCKNRTGFFIEVDGLGKSGNKIELRKSWLMEARDERQVPLLIVKLAHASFSGDRVAEMERLTNTQPDHE